MIELINSSGSFFVDPQGVLVEFRCAETNMMSEYTWRYLDIPEGVRIIPEGSFFCCSVFDRLTLPKSLRVISTGASGAFEWAELPHVDLPDTLEELGEAAFFGSTIRSLRIPQGLRSPCNRQFRFAAIFTLYLPEEFRADGTPYGFCDKSECDHGYIRSMLENDTFIDKVVFE